MRLAILAVAAAVLMPTAAMADDRNFQLINGTGRTIAQVFISPSNTSAWEEDVLSVDVLPDGEAANIHFVDDLDECVYDIMIVHDDGDRAVWAAINLCETSVVSAQYQDDGTPIAQTE
jgi:hypothetical protein